MVVAELGSGSGQKTRWLLEALARRQRVNYYPIDISSSALFRCQQELGQIDRVSIVGFERAYLDGLQEVAARRRDGERLLVLFLGSTIGNFDRPAGDRISARSALDPAAQATRCCWPPISKSRSRMLETAYDDPAGVTAAFNMNLLARINRELGADFDLSAVRARGPVRPNRAARGNASALEGLAASDHPRSRLSLLHARQAKRSGRKARTNMIRRK